MNVLWDGLFIFFVSFLLHVIVWRCRLPRHHTKALLFIFSLVFFAALFLFLRYPSLIGRLLLFPLRSACEVVHFTLLFASLSLFYIINYSAIEVDSPSLIMVLAIGRAGLAGLPLEKLNGILTDDNLIIPRINDLEFDGMIILNNGKYKLTHKGASVARIFVISRRLLRLPVGG